MEMFVIEISYSDTLSPIYQIIARAPPFSRLISSDTQRRGVVVRAPSDSRLRESDVSTSFLAIACLRVSNESMSHPEGWFSKEDEGQRNRLVCQEDDRFVVALM